MEKKIIIPTNICLPKNVDMTKWAVVACDQFTSERKYWEELYSFVGDAPSTLNLILPEAFLKEDDGEAIEKINSNMQKYLSEGLFDDEKKGYVLVERKTPFGVTRVGIVLAIDLEEYSFEENSYSEIRATEGTVLSRIPPRVKIRGNALLELPHIMLLANDSDYSIIENLYAKKDTFEKLYDFDLNMNGGHLRGYFIPEEVNLNNAFLEAKKGEFLFAVGDGNHSLATAKTVYENMKEKGEDTSLSRYALVEVVNLHSEGISFEPIHRLITGVDKCDFLQGLKLMVGGKGFVGIITEDGERSQFAPMSVPECYEGVQGYIDSYLLRKGGEVDYIHGLESLRTLVEEKGGVGIVMPTLGKDELFSSIEEYGSLARKTFSMGEAIEKRYYLESRKIK